MSEMINPHQLRASYVRINDRTRGTHRYFAAFVMPHFSKLARRQHFRTATDAEKYSRRLLARWCRLYDAIPQIANDAMVDKLPLRLLMPPELIPDEGDVQ